MFTFLYYANEESDDIISSSTKTVKHWIKNISRNIRAVFFEERSASTQTLDHLIKTRVYYIAKILVYVFFCKLMVEPKAVSINVPKIKK